MELGMSSTSQIHVVAIPTLKTYKEHLYCYNNEPKQLKAALVDDQIDSNAFVRELLSVFNSTFSKNARLLLWKLVLHQLLILKNGKVKLKAKMGVIKE